MRGEVELHLFVTLAIDDMGGGLHDPAALPSQQHLNLPPSSFSKILGPVLGLRPLLTGFFFDNFYVFMT